MASTEPCGGFREGSNPSSHPIDEKNVSIPTSHPNKNRTGNSSIFVGVEFYFRLLLKEVQVL